MSMISELITIVIMLSYIIKLLIILNSLEIKQN